MVEESQSMDDSFRVSDYRHCCKFIKQGISFWAATDYPPQITLAVVGSTVGF